MWYGSKCPATSTFQNLTSVVLRSGFGNSISTNESHIGMLVTFVLSDYATMGQRSQGQAVEHHTEDIEQNLNELKKRNRCERNSMEIQMDLHMSDYRGTLGLKLV